MTIRVMQKTPKMTIRVMHEICYLVPLAVTVLIVNEQIWIEFMARCFTNAVSHVL
jgi:hypothetical protein